MARSPMNMNQSADHEHSASKLLARTAHVAFDDPQTTVEPAQLLLRVLRITAPIRPSQLRNYLPKLFNDIPAYPCAVFHPGGLFRRVD